MLCAPLFKYIAKLLLEVLSDDEVELAAAALRLADRSIEAPTPVDTEHTDDRQVETYTDTGRTLDLEGRELFPRVETATSLEESQYVLSISVSV